jgi:hypothetical protein
MNSAIVFSKNRACQLDLLLRSVTCHTDNLFDQITVIWTATDDEYERAYWQTMQDHPVDFFRESNFQTQVLDLLDLACDHACFLTDDSVFYRPLNGLTRPDVALKMEEILCFSLRLGLNTGQCYPLRRIQGLPTFEAVDDLLVWDWRQADADFGYMGSLDGHLFHRDDLLDMLDGSRNFNNPNQLEEILQSETQTMLSPYASCYRESHLVGVPVNRVNETHPNRYAETHEAPERDLNNAYCEGRRLNLDSIKSDRVTAAHAEMELTFE